MSDFSATATAEGKAVTNTNFTVTATSSASANSNVSYDDALNSATNLAVNYANETAKYDANLINQATDISTYLIDYNTKQINSAPDLTFYYSVDAQNTSITNTNLGNSALYTTWNGPLFSDINLTNLIGYYTANETIYDINIDRNFYQRSGFFNFQLENGTLSRFLTKQVIQNSQGQFVTPIGVYQSQIASGTDDYLNVLGIFSIIYDNDTLTRKVNVYLN